MQLIAVRFFIPLLVCLASLSASCVPGPSRVKVAKTTGPDIVLFKNTSSLDHEDALLLTGRLKKPDGEGPFPAVVLLHGCGGIQPKRDHRWAERLREWGYVTLQADSFGPRGLSSVCDYSSWDAFDILRKRVNDAYDARAYLAGLPFVDRDRIAVMGWSHGGMTVLQALYKKKVRPFRAAVAFYPSCGKTLTDLNAPLLILIGEADDWTPSGHCVSSMPPEKGAYDVLLKVYPGALHGFDMLGVDTYARGSRGSHYLKHNPEAEADSVLRVSEFLEKRLK